MRLQYSIEDDLIKEAEAILLEQGIPPKVAVTLFFKEVIRFGGLPFRPRSLKEKMGGLKTILDTLTGKNFKKVKNVNELIEETRS